LKIEVKESPIHGLGCFATENILEGKIIHREYCRKIPYRLRNEMEYLDDKGTYIDLRDSRFIRYLNHSHDSNAEWYYDEIDELVILIAEKDISKGDEITFNYRLTGTFS
jgi:SET domain-containing protein